jgi:stringent starvation protein B
MSEISTKPYLLRAIYEWCTDNGYTPYLAAMVDVHTRVPREFVKDGEIVLNISFSATSGLKMDNDLIYFSARFGGVSREIVIPVPNVVAIYAKENGQGMAFDVSRASLSETSAPVTETPKPTSVPAIATPSLSAVPSPQGEPAPGEATTGESGEDPDPPKKGGKPTLTRIK